MILRILAISDFILSDSCSGELLLASIPETRNRFFTSSLLRMRTISSFSLLIISLAVAAVQICHVSFPLRSRRDPRPRP